MRRVVLGATAAAAGALAWGTFVERRWYVLRHVTVPVLRGASQPLRVLHISDLHQLPRQQHRLDFVRRCVRTAPDVIVVTGDLLESDEAIEPLVATLADIARNRVALAVLGSHDYWASEMKNPLDYLLRQHRRVLGRRLDTARLVDGLYDAGYTLVDNRRVCVETPAGLVDVAGLGDAHVGYDRPDSVDWSTPEEPVALRLGVAHAPYQRVLDRFDSAGYDLTLAGHTHGGQVRVPLLGALTNNTDLPLRQSRGLSRYGSGMWLHVSAGLGHSRFAPFRFAGRPEATILDLVARV